MKPTLRYIGKCITIKTIRDFILDSKLNDNHVILLNSTNFDDIVLEYRDFYGESMSVPYELLGISIMEDITGKIPMNRVGVTKLEEFEGQQFVYEETFELYDGEKAYRCGYCGNIVDERGNELFGDERERIIQYLEKAEHSIENRSHGKCCREQW